MESETMDSELAGLTPEMKVKAVQVLAGLRGLSYDAHVSPRSEEGSGGDKAPSGCDSATSCSKLHRGEAVRFVEQSSRAATRMFWLRLGAFAVKSGLRWGGFFGLSAAEEERLQAALVSGRFDSAISMKLGNDPGYCEIAG